MSYIITLPWGNTISKYAVKLMRADGQVELMEFESDKRRAIKKAKQVKKETGQDTWVTLYTKHGVNTGEVIYGDDKDKEKGNRGKRILTPLDKIFRR